MGCWVGFVLSITCSLDLCGLFCLCLYLFLEVVCSLLGIRASDGVYFLFLGFSGPDDGVVLFGTCARVGVIFRDGVDLNLLT